jgi:predicted trehalose synthase
MHPLKAPSDQTSEQLLELTDRLTERLWEAEDIRARLTRARDANVWPDLQSMSQMFSEIQQGAAGPFAFLPNLAK